MTLRAPSASINGKALVEGTDYKSIKFYDAAGNEVAVKNAGSYTAVITKKDEHHRQEEPRRLQA